MIGWNKYAFGNKGKQPEVTRKGNKRGCTMRYAQKTCKICGKAVQNGDICGSCAKFIIIAKQREKRQKTQ